ncbi:MAG: DNA lyase [Bacteroidota bacterium]
MRRRPSYRDIDVLRREHTERQGAILARLSDFAAVPASEYFYELAYCLLTPQSSAANASKAVEQLKRADLLGSDIEPSEILFIKSHYIRFHNTKARRLLEAKRKLPAILSALSSGGSSPDIRLWLVGNVRGLGWKEASHFLRNIGHRNLAILDRHILRNLRHHGVIRTPPRSLTPARYLVIEQRFLDFADAVSIPMDELDLLFWSRETGEIMK